MHDTTDEWTGLPATSRAVVVGLAAVFSVLVLVTTGLGPVVPVVVAAGLALATSLWLIGWTRWAAVGRLLASLLVAPTAVALLAVVGGAVAVASGGAGAGPDVAAAVLVALGCLLTVFGAATAPRGVYDRDRAIEHAGLVGRTTLPLAGAAVVSFAAALVGLSPGGDGAQTPVGTLLSPAVDPLFAPVPGRTHVAVFCLFLSVTTVLFERAVTALPLTELLTEMADETDMAAAVESTSRALRRGSLLAAGVGFTGLVVELGPGQAFVAGTLPPGVYDLVVSVTGDPGLRGLLWTGLVASAVVRLAVWLVRRAARSSADRLATVLAPYLGGSLLAGLALAVAEPAVETLLTTVGSAAPAPLAAGVSQLATTLVGNYGHGPVLLTAVIALLSVAGCATGCLWLVLVVNYLDERTPGVHLAAAGLFGATVFAATLDAPLWLVLCGLVGAVVVWDAGSFGRTLRREVGPAADTRRAELTHAGGTLAVGGVGAALTLGVHGVARDAVAAPPGTGHAALLIALFAAIVLVVALR